MGILNLPVDSFGIRFVDVNESKSSLNELKLGNLSYLSGNVKLSKKRFFMLPGVDDFILKILDDRIKNQQLFYSMIRGLCGKQSELENIEFPIGYVRDGESIVGQIIKYYPESKSLKELCLNCGLDDMKQYICLGDDSLHNLFLLLLEVLNLLEQLFERGIYYSDINPGNILIVEGKIKLIDFEPDYVSFENNRFNQNVVIYNYIRFVNRVLSLTALKGELELTASTSDFEKIKKKVISLEKLLRSSM